MTWSSRLKGLVGTTRLPAAAADRVLLTFDDGPHPEGMPAVLDVLLRFDARAVFIVVGSRISQAPYLLRRILDEERCQDAVAELTGVRPLLYRPPLGHFSAASVIAPRIAGLRPVWWSVDSGDQRMRTTADLDATADRVDRALAGPGLREVVLLHDERTLTSHLLERVLPGLVERGIDLQPRLADLR